MRIHIVVQLLLAVVLAVVHIWRAYQIITGNVQVKELQQDHLNQPNLIQWAQAAAVAAIEIKTITICYISAVAAALMVEAAMVQHIVIVLRKEAAAATKAAAQVALMLRGMAVRELITAQAAAAVVMIRALVALVAQAIRVL